MDLSTMLNTIRANSSAEYQSRVPAATRTNLQQIGYGVVSDPAIQNEFCNALIGRIAMTIVRNKTLANPLALLKKGGMPLGQSVQELFTNFATDGGYNREGDTLLKRTKPDTKVLYHRRNRESCYTVTITKEQLQDAFISWDKLGEFLQSIVTSLYSGDSYDEFVLMKNLLSTGVEEGKITKVEISDPMLNETNAKEFVKTARTISGYFKYPSTNFNQYAAVYNAQTSKTTTPIKTWTEKDKQVLIIRTDILAQIDVEVLAQAFNMSKSELLGRIVEIDDFGDADTYAMLIDEAVTQVRDVKQELTSFYNPQGLYTNYYLHHWQSLSLSLFGNAVAFTKKSSS